MTISVYDSFFSFIFKSYTPTLVKVLASRGGRSLTRVTKVVTRDATSFLLLASRDGE